MKKAKTTSRVIAFVLAALLVITAFTGCASYNELGKLYGIESSVSSKETSSQHDATTSKDTASSETSSNEQNDNTNKNETECEDLVDSLESENQKLQSELEKALAELEEIKAQNAALESEKTPYVEVINGVVYCDVEYFLDRTTVKFADGTAALQAIEKGTPVVLDDVHAIGERANYRDDTFDLPRKDYKIAVTFNGTDVTIADFSNYHWASKSLFLKTNGKTGYSLVETKKSSSLGNFDQLLQAVAVCVPNENAEYGYDFYVAANWNNANPVISKPTTKPQKPSTQPEHTCPEAIEKCGRCDKPIDDCICTPEVIEKCGRCNKPIDDCTCTPEVIEKCGRCDKPIDDCVCKPEIEKIEVCHKCKKPIAECVCKNSEHNEMEDIPNPNDKEEESDHNDLEDETGDDENNTLNPEDPSNDEGGNNNSNNNQDDEIIDTTLNPEDSSNDEGGNNNQNVDNSSNSNGSHSVIDENTSNSTTHSPLN